MDTTTIQHSLLRDQVDCKLLPEICSIIDSLEEPLKSISLSIWKNPELAYEEHFAHDQLTSFLEKEGFHVERNYHLPTAFRAEYQTPHFSAGSSMLMPPTVCFISEYDALPDIGHACGHNLIAISGLAAAVAVKRILQNQSEAQGRIICLGTPAEETTGGKIDLLKTNCFDDITFALMVHPGGQNIANPDILGLLECEIEFFGAEGHGDHRCTGSLNSTKCDAADAAVSLYSALTIQRKHLRSDQQIHGVIFNADESYSKSHYYLRTPTVKEMVAHKQRFLNAVEATALTSGCRFVRHFAETPFEGLLSNSVIAASYQYYGLEFPAVLPPSYGSTDMGNVSNRVASIHPFFQVNSARSCAERCQPETIQASKPLLIHTADFQIIAGTEVALKSTLLASKSMALTGLELLLNKHLARAALDEFRKNIHI